WLMFSNKSLFWDRGYYMKKDSLVYAGAARDTAYKATMEDVNTTLRIYNVNHIVTGHTIRADTISLHFGSKIINTDTWHAGGKSEALLIEGDKFYRVNDTGSKVLLFIRKQPD